MEVPLDSIAVLEHHRFVYVNDSYAQIFGYTPQDLMGQSWQLLYPTEQVDDFDRTVFPRLDDLGQWRGQVTALRKDGSLFYVEVTFCLIKHQQMICISRDVTEQRQTEIYLQEQEEQYRSIFETASDGLSIWDLERGQLVTANSMEYQLYGYTEHEYFKLTPAALIHPDFLQGFEMAIATVKDGQDFSGNSVIIRSDQTLLDVEIKGTLCFYNGKPHGLFMTRDISDRKQAELAILHKTQELEKALQALQVQEHQVRHQNECLEVANLELARASRLKDEFLAAISHELRTPLNGILGMTEILLEEILGSLNPKQHQSVSAIEKSGTHLLELINEVLDVARLESGQFKIEVTPVSIKKLCQTSLSLIDPMAVQKKIRIESIIPPDPGMIWVDEKRIQQVLNNLLSNAVKFTPEGGWVCLQLELDPEGQFLRLQVKDNGIGIPDDELNRIFDRFVQVDGKLNRDQGGLGLGLAIAQRIVTLHHGHLTVSSIVGEGSCFSVTLPYPCPP